MRDLLLDTDNDLNITEDDLVMGESTVQHQQLLLVCAKGEFKESPTATVGVINYSEAENTNDLLGEIRKCFTGDGMAVNNLSIDNGKILIDASYNS